MTTCAVYDWTTDEDHLAVEPGPELALHLAMTAPGNVVWTTHGLVGHYPPVAAFREMVSRFGLLDMDRAIVAGILLEPFLIRPALAAKILGLFVEHGLNPYSATFRTGRAEWNPSLLRSVSATCRDNWGTPYSAEGWPGVVACHLNGVGQSAEREGFETNGEATAASLGSLVNSHAWFDRYRPPEGFFFGAIPTLMVAGFTPWECVRFSVAALSGAQLHCGLGGFPADNCNRPNPSRLKPGAPRWTPSMLAPLPALVVAKVVNGIRSIVLQEPYASDAMLPHPVLCQAGTTDLNALVAVLGRQTGKAFVEARREFMGRLDNALRNAGAYCGLSSTIWVPSKGTREAMFFMEDPVVQAEVDGLWVFQYLLGDKSPAIRQHAFDVLTRLCYGEKDGVDGLAILSKGGLSPFPWGIERVLLEAMMRDPSVARAA